MSLQRIVAVVINTGGGGGTPGGSDTQVQFNNNGVFDGAEGLTIDSSDGSITITRGISLSGHTTGGDGYPSISATGNFDNFWELENLSSGPNARSTQAFISDSGEIDLYITSSGAGRADHFVFDGGNFISWLFERFASFTIDGPVQMNDHFTLPFPGVPNASNASGEAGRIAWDANFFYVCVATNTWKRVALSTW